MGIKEALTLCAGLPVKERYDYSGIRVIIGSGDKNIAKGALEKL